MNGLWPILIGAASGIIAAIGTLATVRATARKVNAEADGLIVGAAHSLVKGLREEIARQSQGRLYHIERANEANRRSRMYRDGAHLLYRQLQALEQVPVWEPPTPNYEEGTADGDDS